MFMQDLIAAETPGRNREAQPPISAFLTTDRRGFLAGAGAFALGVVLTSGPSRADSTAGGLELVRGGDATPSLFIEISEGGESASPPIGRKWASRWVRRWLRSSPTSWTRPGTM